jgi:hypothetical protein
MQLLAAALALLVAEPVPREVDAPGAVEWPADRGEPSIPVREPAKTTGRVPSPKSFTPRERIEVAVGLDPTAPGSKAEKALVDALEKGVLASIDPPARVRRLRAGTPNARQICRAGREDLVIMVGYVPDREEPVLFSHDCRLDMPLGVRGSDAAHEPELVQALWNEHDQLVREGVRCSRCRHDFAMGVSCPLAGRHRALLVAPAGPRHGARRGG